MPYEGDALGIFASDVILRTAIQAGMADLRANHFLLDYCFAFLTKDALTAQYYGAKEVQNAKEWFLRNDCRVVMVTQMNSGDKLPCISIELSGSEEADENTLADIHYRHTEPLAGPNTPWPNLCDPFTPTLWNAASRTFILPASTAAQLDVAEGMVVVTADGNCYPIECVLGPTIVNITASSNTNFTNCVIRMSRPSFLRHMESASFRESYSIGVHVHGEPVHLTYLHSIVVFILLRYREVLLEGRGFERTKIGSTEASRNAFFAQENVFTRYVNISGFVRQYWPKQIVPRITSVLTQPAVGVHGEPRGQAPVNPVDNPLGLASYPWIGNGDVSTLDAQVAEYGIRGDAPAPGAPEDLGPPDGAQGPAVDPAPNGQMASATQNDAEVGTEGNLAVATDKGIRSYEDGEPYEGDNGDDE
jgi:hypothetical protein